MIRSSTTRRISLRCYHHYARRNKRINPRYVEGYPILSRRNDLLNVGGSLSSFSTDSKNNEPSLKSTVERIQKTRDEKDETTEKKDEESNSNEILERMTNVWSSFQSEVSKTWDELLQSGQPKDINKKIRPAKDENEEDEDVYSGPVEIMVIDPSENLTAWERMQKRLTEAPIIQSILQQSERAYRESGAQKLHEKVTHLSEDAREAWETSQNPWVYRVSSVYDTLTAESEFTLAVKELRTLDPDFELEDWKADVVENTLPQIMRWFLEGKLSKLKPWLGESVHNRIGAEMAARKKEGVSIDSHVLGIMNSEIIACEPDHVNKGAPIILLHFMCQQINCVRRKKDGEIVEGSEDDIRANSYVVAFQREHDEAKGELNWKIVDFRFNGAIAYL